MLYQEFCCLVWKYEEITCWILQKEMQGFIRAYSFKIQWREVWTCEFCWWWLFSWTLRVLEGKDCKTLRIIFHSQKIFQTPYKFFSSSKIHSHLNRLLLDEKVHQRKRLSCCEQNSVGKRKKNFHQKQKSSFGSHSNFHLPFVQFFSCKRKIEW